VSMRRTWVGLAVVATLFAGITPSHAEEIEPDAATYQSSNNGEAGYQAITMNVVIPAAQSRTHNDVLLKIAGDCEFNTVGDLDVNQTNLIVAGHASTTVHSVHGVPVATGIQCHVYNSYGELLVKRALPLTNTAWSGTKKLGYANFTMCIVVSVTYDDTTFIANKELCRPPILP
jgi:hypothetical protein